MGKVLNQLKGVALVVSLLVNFVLYKNYRDCYTLPSYQQDSVTIAVDTLTPQHMYDYFRHIGVKFPLAEVAKSMFETGRFKKLVSKNNYGNMKVPAKRYFFGENHGDFDNFARYATWKMYCLDIKSYQMSSCHFIYTSDEYVEFLANHYADGQHQQEYITGVKSIMKELKKQIDL